jgi:hypothetical protein
MENVPPDNVFVLSPNTAFPLLSNCPEPEFVIVTTVELLSDTVCSRMSFAVTVAANVVPAV